VLNKIVAGGQLPMIDYRLCFYCDGSLKLNLTTSFFFLKIQAVAIGATSALLLIAKMFYHCVIVGLADFF